MAKAGLAAKASGLSLGGFSAAAAAAGKLKPPNGLPAGVAGFEVKTFEAPESPKIFLLGREEDEAKMFLGLASGDICIESATAFPVALGAAGCPNRPVVAELLAFWGAPNEKAG